MIQVKQFHFEHTHLQVWQKRLSSILCISKHYYHKNSKTNL